MGHLHYLSLLPLLLFAGCDGSQRQSTEISLATAQRFHTLLKHVGRENGFECHMSGFPEWKLNGLEPSVENVGEWQFTSPTDSDGDGTSEPSLVALVIRLQSNTDNVDQNLLLEWETHKVILVKKSLFESERGSTDGLIASLKGLDNSK